MSSRTFSHIHSHSYLHIILLAVSLVVCPNVILADSCFELVLPLIFDHSSDPTSSPDNPRAHGIEFFLWNEVQYLALNTGNDLEVIEFSDPQNPGVPVASDFAVPPWGDRDYNLFRFSVCDDCRWGSADFDQAGSVLFDLGSAADPVFSAFQHYTTFGVGRLTFVHGGQQYLVANGFGAMCGSFASLHEFNGTGIADLPFLDCLTGPTTGEFRPVGGVYIPGPGGQGFLYLSDRVSRIHVFRLVDGPTLGVEYLGAPVYGTQFRGEGWAVDLDAGLFAGAVNATVRLYDIADPASPLLISEWSVDDLPGGPALVTMRWPRLWVGVHGHNDARTYDITNPVEPSEVDRGFWAVCHSWNSFDYSFATDAELTPDGLWLLLSRFSVVERLQADPVCPGLVFSDGLECGDSSPWSLEYPGPLR